MTKSYGLQFPLDEIPPQHFIHSFGQTKKKSCFNVHCPQLLLVSRSAANFLEDDLPPNQGGAAVEQVSG